MPGLKYSSMPGLKTCVQMIQKESLGNTEIYTLFLVPFSVCVHECTCALYVCCCSVAKSCLTLCNLVDYRLLCPSLFPEFAEIHVH